MHLIAAAWFFVVVLAALAEAGSPAGSWFGAIFTLLGYGILPMALLGWIYGSSLRRRRAAAERLGTDASSAADPDRRGHSPADAVTTEREEA